MTAPVEQVKAAAAEVVAIAKYHNAHVSLRDLTIVTFETIYNRPYDSRTDTKEYARIKWHVKRALSGDTGPGRGGKRDGAGRPKGEQAG